MNADYQLRYATISRHGSFWSTQMDAKTRDMLRELSRAASVPSRLQHIDVVGSYALSGGKTLQEDIVIDFTDGHFVVAGADMQSFVPVEGDPGVYTLVRDNEAQGLSGSDFRAHVLAMFGSANLGDLTADVPTLTAAGPWYLIPKPETINPIVLSTRKPGINLSNGVDFFTSRFFIITQLPPAEYFEAGAIVVSVAEVTTESFEAYPSDSPRSKKGRKWVNTYAKRAQSIELFRRAAAEFCGLYVLPDADVLLNSVVLEDGTYVYAFGRSGVVHVDYTHTPLTVGQAYPAGHVVCTLFEIRNAANTGASFLTSSGAPVDLTGIFGLPLQMPDDGMVEYSFAYVSPSVKTHLRTYFGGTQEHHDMVWAWQMAHERRTGLFLSDELGVSDPETFPPGPNTLNYANLLRDFYGRRLHLLVIDGVPERMKFELFRFIRNNTPTGAIVLVSDLDGDVLSVLPTETPPEGNIYVSGSPLHYETATLDYD